MTLIQEQLPSNPLDPEWVPDVMTVEAMLIILAAVLLLVLAAILFRWLRRPPAAKFKRTLTKADEVSILMHPNPDPDAMAAAFGVKKIAEWIGVQTQLCYSGQIRHQENRAFITVLDLELTQINSRDDLTGDALVLVDHNNPRGFDGAESLTPTIVIDHHIGEGVGREFTDIRPEYGSTSTIITEYFKDLNAIKLSPDENVPEDSEELYLSSEVATGLMYGIHSDTDRFTKGCHDAEFRASSYLFSAIDRERLNRIANPPMSSEVLKVKSNAFENMNISGSFAVANVGEIDDADTIPQAADELAQLEGVTAVVVMGNRNGVLHMSGRSRDDRVHMGRALETAVDEIPMASAGGHAHMGGGQIEIEHMKGLGPSGGTSVSALEQRIFDCMNGNI